MNSHKNARLSAWARQSIVRRVDAGETHGTIAADLGVSREAVNKWDRRFSQAAEPAVAAQDASSQPMTSPTRLSRTKRRQIKKDRQQRWSSPRIAQHYQIPRSTVTAELRRQGLNRLASLEGPRVIHCYERPRPDELGETTAAFLVRAVAWFEAHGIVVERLLTDNGSAYRSLIFATTCLELGITQRFTRAYLPQTHGKAVRMIRTLLTEWAYARAYGRSHWRTRALDDYLSFSNVHRPHSALNYQPPRLTLACPPVNNVFSLYT